jgi:uncharacterized protein YfaS (alpha-2-macroglobulin family)
MKSKTKLYRAGSYLLATLFSFFILTTLAGTRDKQWQEVQNAISKGLPRNAVTNLDLILQAALKEKAYPEAARALATKLSQETYIQGSHPEERITRMQTELAKAPAEMRPILQTLLAEFYWQYFQQNRWRFMRRTATTSVPGKDFTTWDLPRLFAEIDRQFQLALDHAPALQRMPIEKWDELLLKGTMPDAYRPTLFDFIAHEALAFYTSGEQAAARPEDSFEISADSPVFGSTAEFLSWRPAAETNSLPARTIQLFQQLLRFHQNDPAPRQAFAEADLDRLIWGRNVAFGENKNARFRAAIDRFTRDNADDEISALAMHQEALVLQEEGDLLAAHEAAKRGAELFPQSPGGKLCHNLVVQIEARSLSINTERVWNCPAANDSPASNTVAGAACPAITIHYRNLDVVHFRAIPFDWEVFLNKHHNRPGNLTEAERKEVLAKTPAFEWTEQLPPTNNYQEQVYSTPAPDSLKPGFYFIVASHDPEFRQQNNQISLSDVWVSTLALITRSRENHFEGFVLDANSGEPIRGATVSAWHLDNQGNRIAAPDLLTDENGWFSFKPQNNRPYLFRAGYQGRVVATEGDLWSYEQDYRIRPNGRTLFFTDRALYRPGQTIQYKGICLWVDQAKDEYEVLKGEQVEVIFRDVNGKEIARQKQRANDFGSFAGSFVAPRDRLPGQMSLLVEGRASGQTGFRVEEYKRPKFQVTLDAPKIPAKLNDKVVLQGHAMSYTGAAIDSAPVNYHIVRQVRFPWFWGLRATPQSSESQEIAHGTVTTETDGSFKIEFNARPDPRVPEKEDPKFEFHINADVTDSAGETRSAERMVRVGYTALEATLAADDWQTTTNDAVITIETKTLDSEPQVAEGTVKIYELVSPEAVQRGSLEGQPQPYGWRRSRGRAVPQKNSEDLSNPNNWPLGKIVSEHGFTTDTNGQARVSFRLAVGAFRAVLETQDRYGKKVTALQPLQVLEPASKHLLIKIPHLLAAPHWEMHAGETFLAVWGTGYETGRAFVEIEHRNRMIQRYWTKPGQTQQAIEFPIDEHFRGGFTLHITQVRENRAYFETRQVSVPWDNKDLVLRWEHFVSKLQPGQKETWSLAVQPKIGSKKTPAELVAALYDESLDAFAAQSWPERLNIFRSDSPSWMQAQFANGWIGLDQVVNTWEVGYLPVNMTWRAFPPEISPPGYRGLYYYDHNGVFTTGGRRYRRGLEASAGALDGGVLADTFSESLSLGKGVAQLSPAAVAGLPAVTAPGRAEALYRLPAEGAANKAILPIGEVAARKNLNETAFFYPQLTTDSNGAVRMTFTMPEALTKWHFLGFAHDPLVRSGLLEAHAVTAKDLMVQPNPPRFLREGDTIEFSVKISNQSDREQAGRVRLTFANAMTGAPADKEVGNKTPEQPFIIPAKQSRSFAWRMTVPDSCPPLAYKAVAAAATVSDGEEGAVPVLSRRMLVTESLPLPIRGPGTRKFEFTSLLKSGSSKTLQNQSLTAQMVSNPAWYAVLALPYLIEYPYECSEQTFNRFYANSLARSIANHDPKIRAIFDQWKNTPALESPLEKNQELKSVLIEETPWYRQSQAESQARKNVGILFDQNRLDYESSRTLDKLVQMQLPDGAWPWFPGGPANDYITLYITTGFGRLRRLGVDVNVQSAIRSLRRLDSWLTDRYTDIQKLPHPEKYVPTAADALYLYGRSFFLKDLAIEPAHRTAVDFFLKQSRKFWLETESRQTQGHLALALSRFAAYDQKQDSTPAAIMESLKQRSVTDPEMGRFWRDTELSWWWFRAPIETQALMIEAFDEVAHDSAAVEDCKVWLLKQKQTQDWKTTKATADAVYALLLRGADLLSSQALVELKLDGLDLTPRQSTAAPAHRSQPAVEPGTGFYEVRFSPDQIKPKMGEITVKKTDPGVAWGSVHWQYLEDMSKVRPYEGTPLKLEKSLFIKRTTSHGAVLEPVKGEVKVGDELVVRIVLRVDRDMEYIHLKDQRGSGTEPVNVLSQYRYQDGLAYYEATRDTASHFFIDYLPKGTYVFEYSTRVQLRGSYQTGVAEIQCLYAPEFNSHSGSVGLSVR